MTEIEQLTEEYEQWIEENNLPLLSADDLLVEGNLSLEQNLYLNGFIGRWAGVESREQ